MYYFRIFLLYFLLISSGMMTQDYYTTQWKNISSLSDKGDFKSLQPRLLEIQKKAAADGNVPQYVRALAFELNIQENTVHDESNAFNTEFYKKIKEGREHFTGTPRKLYDFLTTEYLLQYFENNFWELRNRTAISSPQQDVFGVTALEDLSPDDFKKFGLDFYLHDENLVGLENVSGRELEILLLNFEETRDRADQIRYVASNAKVYALERKLQFLTDNQFFNEAEQQKYAAEIQQTYRQLLHAAGTAQEKLRFVEMQIEYDCKISACTRSEEIAKLTQLYENGPDDPYKIILAEKIANLYVAEQQNNSALQIIKDASAKYKNNALLRNLQNIENEIKRKNVRLIFEEVLPADMPVHLVLEHANTDQVRIELQRFTGISQYLQYQYNNKKIKSRLPVIQSKVINLPSNNNYLKKKTSADLHGIASGYYILSAKIGQNVSAESAVQVARYRVEQASITPDDSKADAKFHIINRIDGSIWSQGNITVLTFKLDGTQLESKVVAPVGNLYAIPLRKNYDVRTYIQLDNGEVLQLPDVVKLPKNVDKQSTIQIFTDRSLYRPGQQVYYKGIFSNKSADHPVKNTALTVGLYDANNQKVAEQRLVTNAFGSVAGHFLIPEGLLPGNFSLRMEGPGASAYQGVTVEEYKRPKFYTELVPPSKIIQYNQPVTISGKVTAFSSVPMSGAKVEYRITRKKNSWWFWREALPEVFVQSGKTEVRSDGSFNITFTPESLAGAGGYFGETFIVYADVTDQNGETHGTETEIMLGKQPFDITADLQQAYLSGQKVKFTLVATSNGRTPTQENLTVTLARIAYPEKTIRPAFTNDIQDTPILEKSTFDRLFPNDFYDEAEKKSAERVLNLVESWKVDVDQQGKIQLTAGTLPAGRYRLSVRPTSLPDSLSRQFEFEVFDAKKLQRQQHVFLKVLPAHGLELRPKQSAELLAYTSTSATQVFVSYYEADGRVVMKAFPVRDGVATIQLDIPREASAQNFPVSVSIFAENDSEEKTIVFKILPEKELPVLNTSVVREKFETGSREHWKITLDDKSWDATDFELLAAMYDHSLDQILLHSWKWNLGEQSTRYLPHTYRQSGLQSLWLSSSQQYVRGLHYDYPVFSWFRSPLTLRIHQQSLATSAVSLHKKEMSPGASDAVMEIEQNLAGATAQAAAPVKNASIRRNFQETAFFYPQIRSTAQGEFLIDFVAPDALTNWKLMLLAHTPAGEHAYAEKIVKTYRPFVVESNLPRFLREGDRLTLMAKISNLSGTSVSVEPAMYVSDAITGEDITPSFLQNNSQATVALQDGETRVVSWDIRVPQQVNPVKIIVKATGSSFSDAEEHLLSVLPSKQQRSVAVPIFIKPGETKTFELPASQLSSIQAGDMLHYSVEVSTDPTWDILAALPTMQGEKTDNADAKFDKWFAQKVASYIFEQHPIYAERLRILEQKGELVSNLQKNPELKDVLLQNTPWLADAVAETASMKSLLPFSEANYRENSLRNTWSELQQSQNADGGFSWFPGGPSSLAVTQYILRNSGKLRTWLSESSSRFNAEQLAALRKAVDYVDREMELIRKKHSDKEPFYRSETFLTYIDSRKDWLDQKSLPAIFSKDVSSLFQLLKGDTFRELTFYALHRTALIAYRYQHMDAARKLLHVLKERAVVSDSQGAYWKDNFSRSGYYGDAETNHAMALEAFQKITPDDQDFITMLQRWLVRQKEVNRWSTSRATAEVVFTLLHGHTFPGTTTKPPQIQWGSEQINAAEAAVGYVKKADPTRDRNPLLETVTIRNTGNTIIQGGLYAAFLAEQTSATVQNPGFALSREYYKKVTGKDGVRLEKVAAGTALQPGDVLTVRLIINADRNMDFVQIHEPRISGAEPRNQLSGYRFSGPLGYYGAVRDTGSDFFIESLPQGRYVLEYDVVAALSGTFKTEAGTMQNFYAPQLKSHTATGTMTIEPMSK